MSADAAATPSLPAASSSSSSPPPPSFVDLSDASKNLHLHLFPKLFAPPPPSSSSSSSFLASLNPYHRQLLTDTSWYRVKYQSARFGNDCTTPCYTTFYGGASPDADTYRPVPGYLQALIGEVSAALDAASRTKHLERASVRVAAGLPPPPPPLPVKFNSLLVRLYFDGDDNIAWHTDGRVFLGAGKAPVAPRRTSRFVLRHRPSNAMYYLVSYRANTHTFASIYHSRQSRTSPL